MAKEEQPSHLQGYNIGTILKRLEAATSRLEDISVFQEDANKQRKIALAAFQADARNQPEIDAQAEKPKEAVDTPTASVQETARAANVETGPSPDLPEPKQVVRFQELIQETVMPFLAESRKIHEQVGLAAEALLRAFERELDFLKLAARATKPLDLDPSLLAALLPINSEITTILDMKEKFRALEVAPQLCTIAEGAPALSWIVSPLPLAVLGDYRDLTTFWSNRVLKEFKEKDNNMKEWVRLLNATFVALTAHVKEFHQTGVKWNESSSKTLAELLEEREQSSKAAAVSDSGASGSAPPPPPPPPPPAEFYQDAQSGNPEQKPAGGMGAVFADLNQGVSVTSGLKKVDKLLMTHKNPLLRQKGSVPSKPAPPKKPSNLSQSAAAPVKKPARMELIDGSKWMVENYGLADATGPIVIEAEMHQSVFIGHCNGVTIDVRGKANAVTISETIKTAVVLNSLISGVDVIKSVKFGIQVTGVVPMISVDKSDEGTIYLSQESVDSNVQVYTSCTTGLNVNVPEKEEYVECAVPEQLKHSIKNGKLISEVVEHAG